MINPRKPMMLETISEQRARFILREVFNAAVNAAQPKFCLPPYLPKAWELPQGRVKVIGAGKASAAMAKALEDYWNGDLEQISGLVITRYGHEVPTRKIEVVSAAHPYPDENGYRAAKRMIAETLHDLHHDDWVIALFSGGGSALLTHPITGVSLAEKQALHKALLECGASIREINTVRKHLSAVKGGRLAMVCPNAKILTLLISDVPGDDPSIIASAPTIADESTQAEALAVIEKYRIKASPSILKILNDPQYETPKKDHPAFANHITHIIANPRLALLSAKAQAESLGIPAYVLADDIEGNARDCGAMHAALARAIARYQQPFAKPCLLLSGGETTVAVQGQGRGGRNVEFLLGLTQALQAEPNVYALAADTDGIDGNAAIAGAWVTPDTLARAHACPINLHQALANNDGHGFFSALGDSLITGVTYTNVNDFRAILIG